MAGTLEQTEATRRDFTADVAHERRTPLASIAGYIEGLVHSVIPAQPETFHLVRREAVRLQRLVDDLQELSRAEAGLVPVHPRRVWARDLVEATATRLRPQFDDEKMALAVNVPSGLP